MNVPVFYYDEAKAAQSWAAFSALCRAERDAPALRTNPFWTMLRQDAYEAFRRAFDGAVS